MDAIKTIAVLTSGGDAPGMNAALRSVVRIGFNKGFKVLGVYRGYAGLLKGEFRQLFPKDVKDIIQRGGTMLYTARCKEFTELSYQQQAVEILREKGVDALVVIGGDGSFRGALSLAELGFPVIGIPATIDRDLACTDYTIGFDTAVNTAMEAIDKIRDSSTAHERISIIEVMGRSAGYIALWSAIACGAEEVLLPETYDYNDRELIDRILERAKHGKKHNIIVNAEGVGESESLAKRIQNVTKIETRATDLGYMQRGGSPTVKDRVMGSVMGEMAIRALTEGRINRAVVMKDGHVTDLDIKEAMSTKRSLKDEDIYDLATSLVMR